MASMVVTKKYRKWRCCSAAKATFFAGVIEFRASVVAPDEIVDKANGVSELRVNSFGHNPYSPALQIMR